MSDDEVGIGDDGRSYEFSAHGSQEEGLGGFNFEMFGGIGQDICIKCGGT